LAPQVIERSRFAAQNGNPPRQPAGLTARRKFLGPTLASALCLWPSDALPALANTLQELFAQLDGCLAGVRGAAGSELTVVFSLRRDGSLMSKPRITFAHLSGGPAEQRDFARGFATAFDRCLPARVTDGLGGALAGRPLSMRFILRPPAARA